MREKENRSDDFSFVNVDFFVVVVVKYTCKLYYFTISQWTIQ